MIPTLLERLSFVQEPERIQLSTYEVCLERFIQILSCHASIRAIFTAGQIRHPGISDLDVVIVADNQSQGLAQVIRNAQLEAGKEHAYLFDISVINETVYKKLDRYGYFPILTCVYGNAANKNTLTEEEKLIRDISNLTGTVILRWRSLIVVFQSGLVRIGHSLRTLNSIAYSAELLKSLTGKAQTDIDQFNHDVKILREDWFKRDNQTQLVALLWKGILVCEVILNRLSSFLQDNKILGPGEPSTGGIVEVRFGMFLRFSRYQQRGIPTSPYQFLKKIERRSDKMYSLMNPVRGLILELPPYLFRVFSAFVKLGPAKVRQDMSNRILKYPVGGECVISNLERRAALQEHIETVASHLEFLEQQRIGGGTLAMANLFLAPSLMSRRQRVLNLRFCRFLRYFISSVG